MVATVAAPVLLERELEASEVRRGRAWALGVAQECWAARGALVLVAEADHTAAISSELAAAAADQVLCEWKRFIPIDSTR